MFRANGFVAGFLCLLGLTAWSAEGKRYAILVGVEYYAHEKLPPLEYPEDDAQELAQLLTKVGYTVDLLSDSTTLPTKANIERKLKERLDNVTREDSVLVALNGHGVHFAGGKDSYFCPRDARPVVDSRGQPERLDTLVSLTELYQRLDNSGAGVKVLLVDACRNDPDPGRGRGVDADTAPRPPRGVAVLFSCSAGERAFEHRDLKHGIYSHFLLEGLKGAAKDSDGEVTFNSLSGYVTKQTAKRVPLLLGRKQTPNLKADLSGDPVLLTTSDLRRLEGAVSLPKEIKSGGVDFVLIPAGEFEMGAVSGDKDAEDDEKPQHRVRITRPFYLGKFEVTKGQFAQFVSEENYKSEAERDGEGGYGYNASTGEFEGRKPKYTWRTTGWTPYDDTHPGGNVTWNDATAYCAWLSRKTGRTVRLPTEAEWEYAARAGTKSIYLSGNDSESLARIGNVADGTAKAKFSSWTTISARDGYVFTAPVGSFQTNAFGLHDMTGNVWEWCSDVYDAKAYESRSGVTSDPAVSSGGSDRVYRGGSWNVTPRDCRASSRLRDEPAYRSDYLGFRVAQVPSR